MHCCKRFSFCSPWFGQFSWFRLIFADLIGNRSLLQWVIKVMWFVIGGFWSILCVSVFQGSLLLNFRVLALKFFLSYYWNKASLDYQGEIVHMALPNPEETQIEEDENKAVHFHQHLIIAASAYYCHNIWQAMIGYYGDGLIWHLRKT